MFTDADLIAQFWARNEGAIANTAQTYGGYCTTIAHNILSNRQDAEECVNDTWLHAWQSIPPTRPSVLRLWLGRLTRNLSLDRYKKQHAQKRTADRTALLFSELEGCLPTQNAVEEGILQEELTALIATYLRTCSPQARIAFVKRYFYGEELPTIAHNMGKHEGSLRVLLSRTRSGLRSFLEKEGVAL